MNIEQYRLLVIAKGLNMIFLGDADDTKAFEVFFQKIKIGTVFFDKITLLFRVQFKEIKPQNIEQMAMAALFDSIPIKKSLIGSSIVKKLNMTGVNMESLTKRVEDLTDDELDYWVAKAQGWAQILDYTDDIYRWRPREGKAGLSYVRVDMYGPTRNAGQCFSLFDSFLLECHNKKMYFFSSSEWVVKAFISKNNPNYNPKMNKKIVVADDDLKKAICQAVITSVFGDPVAQAEHEAERFSK